MLRAEGLFQSAAAPPGAAPTVVGEPVVAKGTGLSVTVAVPAGAAVGDHLIAWHGTGRTIAVADLHPSFTDSGLGAISNSFQGRLAYRKVQAGDPSSYAFTVTATGGTTAALILVRDADDAVFGAEIGLATGLDAAPTCPSASIGANRLVLLFDGAQSSNAVVLATENAGYPAGSTGLFHVNNTLPANNRAVLGAAYKVQASSGATGTNAFTIDSSRSWAAITAALRPVGG